MGGSAKEILMVLKGFWFLFEFVVVALVYRKTLKSCCKFEIVFMLVSALKILLLLVDSVMFEINLLFFVLVFNSALAYTLSYMLRVRACFFLDENKTPVRQTVWYGIRMLLLLLIMLSPIFQEIMDDTDDIAYLTCTAPHEMYRK